MGSYLLAGHRWGNGFLLVRGLFLAIDSFYGDAALHSRAASVRAIPRELGHNEIRFDLWLAYIYPMVADGDVDLAKLVGKIRAAIIATVNAETDWHEDSSFVRATGGNGNGLPGGDRNHPIPSEVIVWDFS